MSVFQVFAVWFWMQIPFSVMAFLAANSAGEVLGRLLVLNGLLVTGYTAVLLLGEIILGWDALGAM